MAETKQVDTSTQLKSCYRHPEVLSNGMCIGCGKPVCSTCIILYRGLIYCPVCYTVVEITNAAISEQEAKKKKWYYSGPFVIVMLFAIAGPFALPLLWASPKFSVVSKIILTILVILLTVFLLWLIYKLILIILPQMREFYQIMQP